MDSEPTPDLAHTPEKTTSRPRLTRAEWRLLLVLTSIQVTHLLDFIIVMPLGPQFQRELGLTASQIGYVIGSYGFAAAISGLLCARFVDRFDRKKAIFFLYAGFAIATGLCAVVSDYHALLVVRAVAGLFGGVIGACVLAVVGDSFPYERRGTAMGVIMSAFAITLIGGVPIGALLANRFGWWSPFLFIFLLAAIVFVLTVTLVPPLRSHLSATNRSRPMPIFRVLTHPNYRAAYLLMIALVFSSFMVVPYVATFMVSNLGQPQSNVPWIYLVGGAVTLVTMNWFGRLADRFGKLTVFRTLALIAMIPIVALTNLPPTSFWVCLVIATMLMSFTSGRMVPAQAMITACAEPRYRGQFLSTGSAIQSFAMGIAATVAGSILKEGSNHELINYPVVGAIAVFAGMVSIYLAGRLPVGETAATTDPVREAVVAPAQ